MNADVKTCQYTFFVKFIFVGKMFLLCNSLFRNAIFQDNLLNSSVWYILELEGHKTMWSEWDDSCILCCLVICQLSQDVGKLEASLSEKFISQRNATGDLQKEIQRLDLKWEQLKLLLSSYWDDWFTCTLSEKSRPTKAVSGAVPFQKVAYKFVPYLSLNSAY